MNEPQNNPLNDFINQDDEGAANSLFADFPFPEPTEESAEQQTSQTTAAPAIFSETDDKDEKATRLYAVAGKIDQVFPDIAVRASCGHDMLLFLQSL